MNMIEEVNKIKCDIETCDEMIEVGNVGMFLPSTGGEFFICKKCEDDIVKRLRK